MMSKLVEDKAVHWTLRGGELGTAKEEEQNMRLTHSFRQLGIVNATLNGFYGHITSSYFSHLF